MTFKHIKFEDSVVMRSLEKLYKEKGLIKEEPLKKEASSKLDLRASSNLMENILKLCTGLRSYGLDKQANELESNYLSYKKANTLYETSKETGEDLINAAHPKGSHKVDVLGDDLAVVETILDRHLKMIKVVDKVPTGKLASSNIINSVKKALGTDPEGDIVSLGARITLIINKVKEDFKKIERFINTLTDDKMSSTVRNRSMSKIDFILNGGDYFNNIDSNKLVAIKMAIWDLEELIKPNWYTTDSESKTLDILNTFISKIKENILTAIWIKKYLEKQQAEESINKSIEPDKKNEPDKPAQEKAIESVKTDEFQSLVKNFKASINNIELYKELVNNKNLQNKVELTTWLKAMEDYVNQKLEKLSKSKFSTNPELLSIHLKNLQEVNLKLDGFKLKWLS